VQERDDALAVASQAAEVEAMRSFPKEGDCRCAPFIKFTRRQPCAFCGNNPPSEAHHFPGRGRSGITDDLLTAPVCRACHRRCEGERVNGQDPIPETDQILAVAANFRRFQRTATAAEWEAVGKCRELRMERIPF